MKIAIIGAGNIGTLITGLLAFKKHDVTLYTRDLSKWNGEIIVKDFDTGKSISTSNFKVTSDMKKAVFDRELVIFTLPSFANKLDLDKAKKHLKKGAIIGFYPGTGGVEFLCKDLIKNGYTVFGLQRVASVARLEEYGHIVSTKGKRKEMFISVFPKNKEEEIRKLFSELFDIKTTLLPNYLSISLVPSNSLLHTTRLYSLFKDYNPEVVYKNIPLFYENWDDDTSDLIIKCDLELRNILNKMSKIDTKKIPSILEHYESSDIKSLTNKITSIESLKGLKTPAIKVKGGYKPDFSSRYFTADFPYGIILIKAFGIICDIETKNIDKIIFWYQKMANKSYLKSEFELGKDTCSLLLPQNYGISTLEDIYDFYDK